MLQPRRKHQQHAVLDVDDDLLGVLGGQFRDRWPDDCGLCSRIEEIDGVGTLIDPHIVHAAQIIIRMAMDTVPGALRVDVGPTSGDLEFGRP